MFTGIISDIGSIIAAHQEGDLRIEVACHYAPETIKLGDSIACSGACLTVVEILPNGFSAQLSAETVKCTAQNMWVLGGKLNLERALKMGDTLDGHLVTGHADGIATIQSLDKSGDSTILTLKVPSEFLHFIAAKGSIALDGISLTVNKVAGDVFWVNIIPHTWENTTLCSRKAGDSLNFEIDTIARYVARILQNK